MLIYSLILYIPWVGVPHLEQASLVNFVSFGESLGIEIIISINLLID